MPEILTRRLGPWPVWTWLIVVGAGIGVGIMLRRSDLFGGKPEPEPAEPATDDGTYLERPTTPSTGAVPLPVVTSPVTTPTRPTTNLEWEQAAITWLTTQNVDPVVAASAIGKYMQGATLTTQESAVLSLALRHLGSPPEGAPPPVAPAPSSPPPGTGGAPQNTTPGAPRGLIWSASRTHIHWHWSPVPGATSYLVALVAGINTVLHSQTIPAGPKPNWSTASWRSLTPGHPYRIRVYAVNAAGAAGPLATDVARTDP